MAIAQSTDDRASNTAHIIASYGDDERVFLRLGTAIDPDLAPLAADFHFSDRLGKVTVKTLNFQSGKLGQLLVVTLDRALNSDARRCIHYLPTQWHMCSLGSGEDIAAFEQEIYPKPIELLDPSLRQSSSNQDLQDERPPVDAEPTIKSACEFRILLSFGQSLDVNHVPVIDDFRAELDDRWLKIVDVRFVKHRASDTPDIQIDVSEPIEPGQHVVVAYRSPGRHLTLLDGSPLEPFSVSAMVVDEHGDIADSKIGRPVVDDVSEPEILVDAPAKPVDFVERVLSVKAQSDPDILTRLEDEAAGRDPLDSPDSDLDPDSLIDDVDQITRDWEIDTGEDDNDALSEGEQSSPDPEFEASQEEITTSDDEGFSDRKQILAERLEADDGTHYVARPALSLSAKIIYFIPIMVFVWLVFVIAVYVASIAFDLDISRPFANSGPSLVREPCTITSDDGSRYEGQCVNGQISGQGVYTWASGNRYEGGWLDGKRHGRGTLTYAGGARYEGDFREGREHGRGKMVWPNGARYEGFYENGRFHGQGTYISASGNRFEGVFHNGSMTQDGRCTMKNGDAFAGPCRAQ